MRISDWSSDVCSSDLADPAILPGVVFAAPQLVPEGPVFGGLRIGRLDKHAVMLALHLGETVAERFEEILVGIEDGAVEAEGDDPLGPVEGGHHAPQVVQFRLPGKMEHLKIGRASWRTRVCQYV